jgi:hypothetical protein
MLVVKKPIKLCNNVFLYIEGRHLLNVNRLIQTLIKTDQKVNKDI